MKIAPVVVIFYNRPHLLSKLWATIEYAQPSVLIGLSDGPKQKQDIELVNQCRNLFKPTWNCEFIPVFLDDNLGLNDHISQGLTQVFSWYEEAIVLEDDCVPHPSFYNYCSVLLERYKYEDRIFSITGMNEFDNRLTLSSDSSYAFTRFFRSWGWSGWRRTWQLCRWHKRAQLWTEIEASLKERGLTDDSIKWWHKLICDPRWADKWSWDYQFCLTGLFYDKLTIFPRLNAVDNLGFDSGYHANLLRSLLAPFILPPAQTIDDPLRHPKEIFPDNEHDRLFQQQHFDPIRKRRLYRRFLQRLMLSLRIT